MCNREAISRPTKYEIIFPRIVVACRFGVESNGHSIVGDTNVSMPDNQSVSSRRPSAGPSAGRESISRPAINSRSSADPGPQSHHPRVPQLSGSRLHDSASDRKAMDLGVHRASGSINAGHDDLLTGRHCRSSTRSRLLIHPRTDRKWMAPLSQVLCWSGTPPIGG